MENENREKGDSGRQVDDRHCEGQQCFDEDYNNAKMEIVERSKLFCDEMCLHVLLAACQI